MSKKMQQGFTLIELMIVIAIIGILAAIAIPQYQDYVTRSKVTEGLNLAAAAKTAIAETVQTTADFPDGNFAAGLPKASSIQGTYVDSVTVGTDGIITIQFKSASDADLPSDVANTELVLEPATTTGSVAWACGYATVKVQSKSIGPASGTSIPSKYLPANCRT